MNKGLLLNVSEGRAICLNPPARTDIVKAIETRDLLNGFKDLWYQEYLLVLRAQCKDLYDRNFGNMVKIDVVLIKNPTKSRPYWSLGRVQRLITGDESNIW